MSSVMTQEIIRRPVTEKTRFAVGQLHTMLSTVHVFILGQLQARTLLNFHFNYRFIADV